MVNGLLVHLCLVSTTEAREGQRVAAYWFAWAQKARAVTNARQDNGSIVKVLLIYKNKSEAKGLRLISNARQAQIANKLAGTSTVKSDKWMLSFVHYNSICL